MKDEEKNQKPETINQRLFLASESWLLDSVFSLLKP
jgi:hypothetical protein